MINSKVDVANWNAEKMQSLNDKKQFTKPKPKRFIPFAVDGTTEGYIGLCQDQSSGIGVYHDEAETILNAGSLNLTMIVSVSLHKHSAVEDILKYEQIEIRKG